jgi:hypothetical protein
MKLIFPLGCIFIVLGIGVQFGLAQGNPIVVRLDDKTQNILQDATSDHWLETFASAFLGGIMAIAAAWIAFRWQIGKEKNEQREFNLRVLEAICCEIKILREIYDEGTGKMLKEHKAGEPFFRWIHISQEHFTIFESNAEHIGKIDSELAKRIIVIYELMKLTVENFGVNSRYISELERFDSLLRTDSTNKSLLQNRQFYWNQLIYQAELLKKVDAKMHVEAEELFKRFEELKQQSKL